MKSWEADSSLAFSNRQEEIVGRLRSLTGREATHFGRMDVSQMLWHLRGAFRMALGRESCERRRSLLRGPWGRYLVLRSPLPWRPGYPTLAELDAVQAAGPVEGFSLVQDEVVKLVQEFCEAAPEELLRNHPLMGRMQRDDWMCWGYRHTDHHLRQFGIGRTGAGASRF